MDRADQIEALKALAAEVPSPPDPPDTTTSATSATSAALAALSWIVNNLPRFCSVLATDGDQNRYRWEWHAALAVCLLRATYQPDLAPPKRAVASVAAHDQLVAAVAALPDRR